ncbi:MAG: AAA family ATPase [Candidatus Peregrinibacteria bacterium]
MKNIHLTSCQKKAMPLLKGKENVFLTGEAGTGKSYLLGHFLKGKGTERYPVVASTGASAILVGGRTFHSFFGLGILEGGSENTIRRALRSRKLIDRLIQADCLVIDEVSMLSGTVLETAERIAQKARDSDAPWGGLRIIAVGDFAQLPPVDDSVLGKEWGFLHEVWQRSQFVPILLKTVVRTQDTEYLKLLQSVRNGDVSNEVENYLNSKIIEDADDFEGTRLYPHRASVDAFNVKKLNEIKGELQEFETAYTGKKSYVDILLKKAPIPKKILLKKGALIMIRKNDISYSESKMIYVNGSLGYVHKITEDTLEIDLMSGRRIKLGKQSFDMLNGDGDIIAQAYNFPVNLAWASTIHKAQGATIDRVLVQLQSLWEPGQAYVALSRTRSGDNLFLASWSAGSIIIDPMVKQYYEQLAQES